MAERVLVAYATKYGSTAEVAEKVGERLRGHGLDADVKPVRDVGSLDGYRAVVLGSPMYIGSLLKDATAFLERNRAALESLRVAVFALGPLRPTDDLVQSRKELEAALEKKTPWLKPVTAEVFVGAYDPAKLKLADKLVAVLPASPLHDVPAMDNRDWDTIGAWADALAVTLGIPTRTG